MSRQSKQAANAVRAAQFAGGGPEKTMPKHGKRNGKRQPGSPLYDKYRQQIAKISERMKNREPFSDLQGAA